MSRIIIGALSGWAYPERRQRCLSTWLADAEALAIRAVFLLGCPTLKAPEQMGPHTLCLPCPDDYPSLPQRTLHFCRWALQQSDWDYLFKADDDTYVSIPRLLAYDQAGRDYIGSEWKPGAGYASGGSGYFLSRKAAGIVAEKLTVPTGAEDMEVGKVLRAAGVCFSIDQSRFRTWGDEHNRPAADNNANTLHGKPAWGPAHAETGLAATRPSSASPAAT